MPSHQIIVVEISQAVYTETKLYIFPFGFVNAGRNISRKHHPEIGN
ncbi:hypothetical protein SDC9_95774 [bioreactor metagenome]|uniref:Uncharacterized protein n=1 Tax=bioreactor metagenome TaxID=1076179 RepID=A0A645A801_9ZZZZ